MTKYNLAKIAVGSVIMLASLACAAISLAWVKLPTIPFFGPLSLPLYGLPYVRRRIPPEYSKTVANGCLANPKSPVAIG